MDNYLNKIICGDCISTMDMMQAESVDLIITSPPYNVGIPYDNYNDSRPFDEYHNWCKQWLTSCYRVLKNNRRIAINVLLNIGNNRVGRDSPCIRFGNLLREVGFNLNNVVIWEDRTKNKLSSWGSWKSASSPYIYCPYEVIIMASKGNWKREDKGVSDITGDEYKDWVHGMWKFSPQHSKSFPVPFPEELPRRCIKLLSYVNDIVLDPFCGAGTTCLAAKKLNRRYIGIDISSHYCRLARNRLKIFF